ncbi:MAG: hypothetical protein ACRCVW_01545 [Brevinema sp.]
MDPKFNRGTYTTLEDIALYRSVSNGIIFDISDTIQAKAIIQY